AFAVLAADNVARDFAGGYSPQTMDHLYCVVANTVGAQVARRFHRDKTKQLEQMVLHHVAQRARAFVITSATFDPERFRGRNLDVINVTRVPERFENGIGKAEH